MPDLNTLPVISNSRQPRGAVKLGGVVIDRDSSGTEKSRVETSPDYVDGWISWEVDNNAYRGADTFRITFSITSLPKSHGVDWFSRQSAINVEIFANENPVDPSKYQPSSADRLIYGNVDEVSIDQVHGTVDLHGRDLTALLIDTKSSEHFSNQTASQIATTFAVRNNLGTSQIFKTKTKAGDYYQIDHDSTTQMQSEWDLLSFLANAEGFLVYVVGKDLFFGPQQDQKDEYVISWEKPNLNRDFPISNVIDLQFSRALHIAKGISVEVHSWNTKQKKGFSAFWPRVAKSIRPGEAMPRTQAYRYTFPGLTQEQANQRAQSIYAQIIAHTMNLTAYMPGDGLLDCSKKIRVQGTESAFDQIYYPESVMRSMSIGEGYRMNIRAKNTSPELDVSA